MSKYIFILVVFVFASCGKEVKSPEPSILIDEEKMVDIMYDIRLISAAKAKNYKKMKDSAVQIDKFVYHKYKLDSITLRQNLDYYATHSFKKAKDIEYEVRQRLEASKNEVSLELKKQDSVKLLKKEKVENKLKFKKEKFKSAVGSKKKKKKVLKQE